MKEPVKQDTRLTKLYDLAKRLTKLYYKKKDLELELKTINKEIDFEISPEMDNITNQLRIGGFELPGIGTITKKIRPCLSFKADKKEQLKEVLRKMGFEALIKETVEANSVLGVVNDYDKEGKPLPKKLKDCINLYLKPVFRPPKRKIDEKEEF